MNIITGIIAIFIIAALLIATVKERLKGSVALIAVIFIALITSLPAIRALQGELFQLNFYGGSVFGNIPVHIDSLSAWFILIINITCINGALYGSGYMKQYTNQKGNIALHWILYMIFHVSMISVCALQNSLAFLIAWEIMSVSSLLLVIFEHYRPDTLKAGLNYLIQTHIGVACLSVAFIRVYFSEGTFEFTGIASFFILHQPAWIFLLFFIGFGFKAGIIPLHSWLPHAHPAAPSHVSGVMSGVIVKMGIYGILRLVMFLKTDLLITGEIILILSVITALYGILNVAVHSDIKRMLAFCTIENIGIIGTGIGMGMIGKGINNPYLMLIGFTAALLHTLNHSLFKSLLFFTAGNVYQQTHTRNMEHLGGLIKKMPATAFFFLCGALAIGGLPPFNGFISEFLIYTGLIEGVRSGDVQFSSMMILCMVGLVMVGGVSILSFTKSFGGIFLGSPRIDFHHQPEEVSVVMLIPLVLILFMMLLIGIFPNIVFGTALAVATHLSGAPSGENLLNISPVIVMVGRMSLLMIVLVSVIYFIRTKIIASRPVAYQPTWGCSYVAPNVKMQYTGKSFSKSFAKLFSYIVTERKKYFELQKTFPLPRTFQSSYEEFFEKNMIEPVSRRILTFMYYFTFINNGKIQMYVLYGFFFIVALIVATFFNIL